MRLGQIFGTDDQPGQLGAAIDVFDIAAFAFQMRAVDEHRVGDFRQSVAQLVKQHGLLGPIVLAGEILIDQLDRLDLAAFFESPQGPRLAEERVHLPELVLLPVVERMVVALRALHLQAQEDLRGLGRGLHAVFLQVAGQEIDEPVEPVLARLADALGRDQLVDQFVVGHVALNALAQRLLQALAIDQRTALGAAAAANQQVGPQRGPIAGVLFDILVAQQTADQARFAPLRGLVGEALQLVDRGNAA